MKRSTRQTLIALTPAVVGGSALAIVGLILVRACVPSAVLFASNDVIGNYLQTLGGIYAVLLAFVVVIVWQQFNDARSQVEREANEIVDLFRTTQGLPDEQRKQLADCLARYVDAVLGDEWVAMRTGDEAVFDRVGDILDEASSVLHDHEPQGACQVALHSEALARFGDLSDARSMRLSASRARIPRALRWLLYMGAFVLVGSTWLFAVDNFTIHAIVTAALAGGVSHVIYVIEDLDDSFGGDWQVPRESFERVRAHMQRRVKTGASAS
jgi:RNAse (barnase) inhibitor barstar